MRGQLDGQRVQRVQRSSHAGEDDAREALWCACARDLDEGVRICERGERIAQGLWLGQQIVQVWTTNSVEIDGHAISLLITR